MERHSSACMEISFFPLSCQQAGRDGPKGAVSPVHLVVHQFINSKIKMRKGSGERPVLSHTVAAVCSSPELLPSTVRDVPIVELKFFSLSLRLGEKHEVSLLAKTI